MRICLPPLLSHFIHYSQQDAPGWQVEVLQHPFGHLPVLQVLFVQQVGHSAQQFPLAQQDALFFAVRWKVAFALPTFFVAHFVQVDVSFFAELCACAVGIKPANRMATTARMVTMRFKMISPLRVVAKNCSQHDCVQRAYSGVAPGLQQCCRLKHRRIVISTGTSHRRMGGARPE